MSVLLTGASGFVGGYFLNEKYIKRIVLRSDKTCKNWLADKFYVSNINGNTDWSNAFEGIDTVVHLAAYAHSKNIDSKTLYATNVDGTLCLARAAILAGVKRFIFVSTVGVHGSVSATSVISTKSPIQPDNEYSKSKLLAEIELKKLSDETKMDVVILRPTLIYGRNAPGNFGMLSKLITIVGILPFGLVNNKRSFISVKNLKSLLEFIILNSSISNGTYIAADNEPISTKEFTNLVSKGLGKKIYQLPIPLFLLRTLFIIFGKPSVSEQLIGSYQVDSSDLKSILGWSAPYSVSETMKFTK